MLENGGALQYASERLRDDDAVVRFSFNVGADGKLEGAFRIADDEVERITETTMPPAPPARTPGGRS